MGLIRPREQVISKDPSIDKRIKQSRLRKLTPGSLVTISQTRGRALVQNMVQLWSTQALRSRRTPTNRPGGDLRITHLLSSAVSSLKKLQIRYLVQRAVGIAENSNISRNSHHDRQSAAWSQQKRRSEATSKLLVLWQLLLSQSN